MNFYTKIALKLIFALTTMQNIFPMQRFYEKSVEIARASSSRGILLKALSHGAAIEYTEPLDPAIVKITCDHAPNNIKYKIEAMKSYPGKRLHIKQYLFVGPHGSGKTTLARAIAQEAGWSCVYVPVSDFLDDNNPYAASTKLFDAMNLILCFKRKCVVILHHLTSVTSNHNKKRKQNDASGMVCDLLDKFKKRDDIIVIATTNDADDIEPRTKDRLKSHIVNISMPSLDVRIALMNHLLQNALNIGAIDTSYINILAHKTKGKSFVDIVKFSHEASERAKYESREIERADIDAIIKKWKSWWHPIELYRAYSHYTIPIISAIISAGLSIYQYKLHKSIMQNKQNIIMRQPDEKEQTSQNEAIMRHRLSIIMQALLLVAGIARAYIYK